MTRTGKLPWVEQGGFDMKTFLIAVVTIGVLVGIGLWILVAVRGRQLLPKPANPEPHSQLVGPLTGGAVGERTNGVTRAA